MGCQNQASGIPYQSVILYNHKLLGRGVGKMLMGGRSIQSGEFYPPGVS